MIPFGPWLPDLPDFEHPGLVRAENVYTAQSGYIPAKTFQALSPALVTLNTVPKGAIQLDDVIGTNVAGQCLLVGTTSNIYRYSLSSGTRTLVNRTSAAYTALSAGNKWAFTRYKNYLFAASGNNILQVFDGGFLGNTDRFKDVTGAPTTFYKQACRVKDFLVLSGYTGGAADTLKSIRWSGFDSPLTWESGTNQSDLHFFDDAAITVVGGDYGVVFTTNQVWRMTYVGISQGVFQFDLIAGNAGTRFPRSVVSHDRFIWYVSGNSFYEIVDGTTLREIGREIVNRFADIQPGDFLESAYDAASGKVMWLYGQTTETLNKSRLIVYDRALENWSLIFTDKHTLAGAAAGDVIPKLIALDNAGNITTLTGAAPTATLETGEFGGADVTNTMDVRPYIQGNSSTVINVYVGHRNKLTDTVVWTAAVQPDSMGKCNFRSIGRFKRLKFEVIGGFQHCVGYDVTPKFAGKR